MMKTWAKNRVCMPCGCLVRAPNASVRGRGVNVTREKKTPLGQKSTEWGRVPPKPSMGNSRGESDKHNEKDNKPRQEQASNNMGNITTLSIPPSSA